MAEFKEMLIQLGAIRVVEPMVDTAYANVQQRRWLAQEGDDPHGLPWHVSFHASSFPGDDPQACGRLAMYGLMDVPKGGPTERWLHSTATAGKSIELDIVRHVRDDGMLVRSGQQGRSSDPDAKLVDPMSGIVTDVGMPQMGFRDDAHWLTGSVDMPMLPLNYHSPFIVEVKTKHEAKIIGMARGEKSYDEKHRRQLLCSLGLAHENPDAFLHPTDDSIKLDPPTDGAIYYVARDTDWPGPVKTFEFYFQYDAGFMEEGRAKLAEWRQHFLDDRLPEAVPRKNARSHPNGPGWRWSEGACKYCPLKKACRADYDNGVTKLSESHAVALASFARPGYTHKDKRKAVLQTWGIDES